MVTLTSREAKFRGHSSCGPPRDPKRQQSYRRSLEPKTNSSRVNIPLLSPSSRHREPSGREYDHAIIGKHPSAHPEQKTAILGKHPLGSLGFILPPADFMGFFESPTHRRPPDEWTHSSWLFRSGPKTSTMGLERRSQPSFDAKHGLL